MQCVLTSRPLIFMQVSEYFLLIILQAIEASVKSEEDDAVLKGFVELAETAPQVVKPNIQNAVTLMLHVSSTVTVNSIL